MYARSGPWSLPVIPRYNTSNNENEIHALDVDPLDVDPLDEEVNNPALSHVQQVNKDEQTCIICYNEFGVPNAEGITEHVTRLQSCEHVFGDLCINKWLETSDTCPYCRNQVQRSDSRRA
ncbi:hypothetical protein QBC46DRAFT_343758 [Diplogelasinospora grovesii]|uniref:RING-type domain-containing protein n=1 Tax=Diplogelasinospora grovesii TaxID=303347 RepID=A0AAN6S233_9PEZI|nr:hypothetical protein QBC46DRAFT_343758 [Diplogelasinospora grovesii]